MPSPKKSSPKKSVKKSSPKKTSLANRVKAVANKLTTKQKAAIGAAVLATVAAGAGYGIHKYRQAHKPEPAPIVFGPQMQGNAKTWAWSTPEWAKKIEGKFRR